MYFVAWSTLSVYGEKRKAFITASLGLVRNLDTKDGT
jgi:hypothetical protein